MHRAFEFLIHHGYVVLLGWVFVEQAGIPVPATPLLLAAGALAGAGDLNIFAALFWAGLGAVAADSIWFQLGRHKGIKILQLLCRISLEPDSCVRRTEGIFSKQGARSLLLAKFVPGLGLVTPPLAGIFHMRFRRFLLFDAMGSMLWAAAFLSVGYAFSGQIERVAERLASLGGWLLVLIVGALALYIGYKFVARQRFLHDLRIARITAEELKKKIDSGEELVIVDLRHSLDFEAEPEIIPGALHMDAKELQEKNDRLPRDREVILYCT
ncbi:MAG TPA: VTT domain-containing protein [Candidatus Acidoferrum sp.]|jgi:membrane protein DedA with SNARE-associated domain|nr:VTT domain-containing protein [Candidatus Acidoferrum sp.]